MTSNISGITAGKGDLVSYLQKQAFCKTTRLTKSATFSTSTTRILCHHNSSMLCLFYIFFPCKVS